MIQIASAVNDANQHTVFPFFFFFFFLPYAMDYLALLQLQLFITYITATYTLTILFNHIMSSLCLFKSEMNWNNSLHWNYYKKKAKKNQLKWVFAILHFIYLLSQSDSNKTKFKWIDVQLHWNVDFSLMYKYITSNHINWTWNAGRSIFIHIDTIIMNMNDLQIYIFARNVAIVISDYVVVFEPVR